MFAYLDEELSKHYDTKPMIVIYEERQLDILMK